MGPRVSILPIHRGGAGTYGVVICDEACVDSFLLLPTVDASPSERTNLRFHLSMLATAQLYGGRVYSVAQLRELAEQETAINDADLEDCLRDLSGWYEGYMAETGDGMDKAAKSGDFVEYIFDHAFPVAASAGTAADEALSAELATEAVIAEEELSADLAVDSEDETEMPVDPESTP
jgi:hypothetical protein